MEDTRREDKIINNIYKILYDKYSEHGASEQMQNAIKDMMYDSAKALYQMLNINYNQKKTNMPTIKFKLIDENSIAPIRATEDSAGFDLHADLSRLKSDPIKQDKVFMDYENRELLIPYMGIAVIPTGFKMQIDKESDDCNNYEAQVRPRSGIATKGISIVNSPGTIDEDFRGEVKVILINLGNSTFTVKHGDRIAQMVINVIPKVKVETVTELTDTKRGEGGFGSTGTGKIVDGFPLTEPKEPLEQTPYFE